MKNFKRIISLILCVLCFVLAACAKTGEGGNENGVNENGGGGEIIETPATPEIPKPEQPVYEETGDFIVNKGATEYKILVNKKHTGDINIAVSEFNTFFSEATGVTMDVVYDDGSVEWNDNAKYISIGRTPLMEKAGVTVKSGLGTSGTQMSTKGKSVFLTGETDLGALYAVYDFLGDTLNFEYYYTDIYSLDKNVQKLELRKYNDVINVPDIEFRSTGYGYQAGDTTVANRMRLKYYFDPFITVNGFQVHNSLAYIKGKDAGHESFWYSTDGTQLCYTARGDKTEYAALQDACFETMKSCLMTDRTRQVITFTIQDENTFCSCEACQSVKSTYGANSACVILFVNDLRKKVDAWFAGEGSEYARDLDIIFFAYYSTVDAPVTYNEATGEFTPNNGIHCADGVSVFYAPIEADYTKSPYDSANKSVYNTMKAWNAVSDNMYLWLYSTMFFNYVVYYDNFNGMQDWYKFANEVHAKYIFDQAQYSLLEGSYAWGNLKGYLNAKLAWNKDADVGRLTENFFKNCYGPAADKMLEFYTSNRIYCKNLIDNTADYSGNRSVQNRNIDGEKFWSKSVLTDWLGLLNGAVGDIEYLKKVDLETYNRYYKMIASERLTVLYMFVNYYSYNTYSGDIAAYKKQFAADIREFGFSKLGEVGTTVSGLLMNWGV